MIRDLEVRHCRALVAVYDHGGVGAAARALGVAQSTVSETLLSLERLLGAPVTLRRAGREAVLSAAAETLLPHARMLISVSEAGLAAATRPGKAVIRLGTVESISSFLLPGPLSAFRLSWPEAEVRITIGLCEDLRKRVARSELDVALTVEGAGRPHDPQVAEAFWPSRLRLIVAPRHPLAQRRIERRDLEGRICLLADPEGAFNELVRSWVGNPACPPRLESAGSIDGVKRGVLGGDAIGALPDYAVIEELSAGSLAALDTADPTPRIALCLTTREAPPPASALESLMAKIGTALDHVPAGG